MFSCTDVIRQGGRDSVEIALPFLDDHFNNIILFVERGDDGLIVTDHTYYVPSAMDAGVNFLASPNKTALESYCSALGVKCSDGEIWSDAFGEDDLPLAINSVLQVCLFVCSVCDFVSSGGIKNATAPAQVDRLSLNRKH